ncbi:endonuclease/exonuclease/phosphatase family protein [Williamwhitmania taraxaci]|uniref:Endonuclease/Exonuclease/phosphatase family protein n=1 Tax=Williamwhitmania taraxaci TaxID=1640674 RepID=A0A1G6GRH5_9BACT|nr:endonuclease/exonuclease/phosphatase family protein [Williamwhitmania taraxaci]SDB84335.1 Endonuclease/Exonuclease/phosphatase family protein [Williamwhitmania taraxaci]
MRTFFIVLYSFFCIGSLCGQDSTKIDMLWYNVENLFDPFHDTLKLDQEFTIEGARHWSWNKMEKKIDGICKVLVASGKFEPPLIVGLCEVENRFVLNRLVYNSPLSKFEYRIVHAESPDFRGIDVALLYRSKRLWLKNSRFIRSYEFDDHPSRDILYAKFLVDGTDSLHIFLNHWPSKYGGELETEHARSYAATILSMAVDSVLRCDSMANIVVMGDFNDEATNVEVAKILKTRTHLEPKSHNKTLVNLSSLLYANGMGTHKYQGRWAVIDQVMVSEALLSEYNALRVPMSSCKVFDAPFLLERDDAYTGQRPFRTFIGFRYHGGFSDHLPVLLTIRRQY